jgi:hypothetical protein
MENYGNGLKNEGENWMNEIIGMKGCECRLKMIRMGRLMTKLEGMMIKIG